MKNKKTMTMIPSSISHSNPEEQDLVSHQKFILSRDPTSSPGFIVITTQVPRPAKCPCGHHGLLGHNTEETGVVPTAKAAPGNQGRQSLQRGGAGVNEATHPQLHNSPSPPSTETLPAMVPDEPPYAVPTLLPLPGKTSLSLPMW